MKINMNPAPRGVMLSTSDVARREGVRTALVTAWCRNGGIWPAQKVGSHWLISHAYVTTRNTKIGRPRTRPEKVPSGLPPGRPKGSKNKRPYPKGVKRPRKNKKGA